MSGADIRVLPGQRFSAFRSNTLPEGVSFAFYAPGDSLQPYFEKDALVYCDDHPLRPGDIGLFCWNGETVCRQYHKDAFGITYLFDLSGHRERDIVIPAAREPELLCYGRVQLEERPVLPPGR